MKKITSSILAFALMLTGITAFADTSFATPVILCCGSDVYAADYVFSVERTGNISSVNILDKNCISEWNFIESEARLYISLASATPLERLKTIAEVISDTQITLIPVSVTLNGKTADPSCLSHTEADMEIKEPTIDSPGASGGKVCSVCSAILKEPDTVIPPTGPKVSASLSVDNKLTVSGAISDNKAANCTVLLAVYGSGKFMHIVNITDKDQNAINIDFENMKNADTVKIFRWENLSNIKPIHNYIEVEVAK